MKVKLKVIAGPHNGREFTFSQPDTFLIGRTEKAHFCLPHDRFFSRNHCLLEIAPPQCFLRDLGSTNGTFVNGKSVHSTYLRNGDRIQGGETVLLVQTFPDELTTGAHYDQPADSETAVQCLNCNVLHKVEASPEQGDISFICEDCRRKLKDAPQPIPGYEMVRLLGKGGMGTVMLARQASTGRAVAVKTLLPEVAVSEQSMQRFVREIKVASMLKHPHIVEFIEQGAHRGIVYLVTEFVDGNDASKLMKLRGGRLNYLEVGRITEQILDALEHAHRLNFVHRDIKDQNLLIEGAYPFLKAKLTDFGLAKSFKQTGLSGVTMVGDVAGTIAYMPPEQIRDFRDVRPAADIYSMGMTAFSLLTGRHALNLSPKAGIAETIRTIFEKPNESVSSFVSDVPPGFAYVIEKALAKEAENRWRSAAEMREAILRAMR